MDKISDLKSVVIDTLDLNKAQDIVTIDLKDKSSMADYMIIASGTSSRHIQSLSEQVLEKLKDNGIKNSKIEGKESNEWKLVDGIDLINYLKKDKNIEIFFLMGADNLINFHKWFRSKLISQKCNIIVFDRHGYKKNSLKSKTFKRLNNKTLTFVEFKKVNISSSQLRKI